MLSATTIPSKIFLLGEYSVLQDQPALVAALRLPVGSEAYGFGSSTGRFILKAVNEGLNLIEMWERYKQEFPLGSGADLLAQAEALKGRESVFEITIKGKDPQIIPEHLPDWQLNSLLVFSATHQEKRKLNTGKALRALTGNEIFPKTDAFIQRWKNAKTINDFSFLSDWADALSFMGLETADAHEDRKALSVLPGVRGVKGCGAGLNDAFLVAVDFTNAAEKNTFIQKIQEERNLMYLGTLKELLWTH